MASLRSVVLSFTLMGLGGCQMTATQPEAEKTSIAPANTVVGVKNGATALRRGQTLVISLPSNATTGYSWSLADVDEGVLTRGSPFGVETTDPHPAGMVGVGGKTEWTFNATGTGHVVLVFTYARSWEKDTPPAETARYDITVR